MAKRRQKRSDRNPDAVAIGSRIKQARERTGRKQRALADAIEIDAVTLWRWEQGDMMASATSLAKIASELGVTLDWLIRGEHKPAAKARLAMGTWADPETCAPQLSMMIMQGEGNGRLLKLLLRALEEKGSDAVEMALKVELAL